jgi:hypothetical protein
MGRRLSSKEFLEYLNAIYEEGPTVKYQNPDAWIMPSYTKIY